MAATKIKSIPNEVLLKETAQLIREGHTVTHIVRGNSMNPFMVDRRDKVTLSPFTAEELQPGVVVLARATDARLVLHRIIDRKGDMLTLMGDGNVRGTEQALVSDVMGKVIQVIRKGQIHDCAGKVWHRYSAVWIKLQPVRRILLGIYRRIP